MNTSLFARLRAASLALAGAALLAACGGGTDGTGGTPPNPGPTSVITSAGALTKTSAPGITVNNIRFDDGAATIGDDRGRTRASLATGMVVKLRGRSDDNVNGTAERIELENEVRGAIASVNAAASPQSFVVAGLTVLVDSQTVYANVAGFGGLAAGLRVEVHGLRDATNLLRATRVEVVAAGDGLDEIRGPVSAINTTAKTFTLNGTQTVNYGGATFSPAGASDASLGAGTVVEVRGSLSGGVFTATQVDIEDLEDDSVRGRANEKQEIEGFVSGFTATPGSFKVDGRDVQTTASTRFVGGTAADLANNAKVEAEGTINASGVLVASRIEFRSLRVLLHGRVTAVNASARTLVVLGQTVQANDLTRIDTRTPGGNGSALTDLVVNTDCVEVRAGLDGSTIVAEEIKEPSGCGKELVQARVTAKSDTAFTLTFFGPSSPLNASLTGASVFRDLNGNAISRAQFFAAVTAAGSGNAGTLVKVKGNSLSAVEEAELED